MGQKSHQGVRNNLHVKHENQHAAKASVKECMEENCALAPLKDGLFCSEHCTGKRCQETGCTKQAQATGRMCADHALGSTKRCVAEGCARCVVGTADTCLLHCGPKLCLVSGCSKATQAGGSYCKGHGGAKRKPPGTHHVAPSEAPCTSTGGSAAKKQKVVESAVPAVGANVQAEDGGGVCAEDLRATLRVLAALAHNPDLYRSKGLRSVRALVHSLSEEQLAKTEAGFTARISQALAESRWEDALLSLEAMRAAGRVPKLGTLQRWIRNCDAWGDDLKAWQLMDACIRVSYGAQEAAFKGAQMPAVAQGGRSSTSHVRVERREAWSASPKVDAGKPGAVKCAARASKKERAALAPKFRVLHHEQAADRQPPNKHDLRIYVSEPSTIVLDQKAKVSRVDCPDIPGAFLLTPLLSPAECKRILAATEAVGWAPDEPLTNSGLVSGGGSTTRADTFVWLADESLLDPIYERCKSLLPSETEGCQLAGMNARWRLYRYGPGAVYRPHVDGAWPGSGLDEVGNYKYDVYGDRWSRFTFLIYLNDDFEGGYTTFYTPGPEVGHLQAQSVSPRTGHALVFPHGGSQGSLVHEGSAPLVGTKYVIRTDVLYLKSKRDESVGMDS